MANPPIKNAQGQEIAWKPTPTGSVEFQRLNQILELRIQPWVEISASTRLSQANRPKLIPYEAGEIESSIAALQEDERGRALFRACIHGDLKIAKEIWNRHGPFEVRYGAAHNGNDTTINDELVHDSTAPFHYFTNIKDSAELSELMEWMPTVGMGFLVGVGADSAPMLQSMRLEKTIQSVAWASRFEGDLPTLTKGVLTDPELMLTLQARSNESSYPVIFKEVLCWMEEGSINQFEGHVSGYQSIQSLFLDNHRGTEYLEVPIDDVTDDVVKDICTTHLVDGMVELSDAKWKYRSLNLQTFPNEPSEPKNRLVLGYQADEPLKHGFNHKPGYVLCRTTVDFLEQFPIGTINQGNLAKAQEFSRAYFPLDLAMLEAPQKNAMHTGCLARKNGMHQGVHDTLYLIKTFYKGFADASPLQPYLQKSINSTLFGFIKQHHCYVPLDADSMIALKQGLGLDNAGFSVDIDYKDLSRLYEAGYRFSDDSLTYAQLSFRQNSRGGESMYRLHEKDTEVKFNAENPFMEKGSQNQSEWDKAAIKNRYSNAISMNLWPAETTRPQSLSEAVVMAGRKKKWGDTPHEQSLLAYIDHAGMKACAEVAKTTPHWTFLKDHFGREAMDPYMGTATRAARGKILMDDLGM